MTLTVTDLCVSRAGMPVVEDLSFSLEPGQALVLRGPNGIGKTTLLRTLAGLQPPDAGTITGGEDQIAYAGHADGIKPTLTVRENLSFWARVFASAQIDDAIWGMDLFTLSERPAGALSAGQKRRLGLARLLVTGRPIWLLDEPTVSLDAAAVTLFAEMVRKHLGQGGSALIATHIDLGLDAKILDLTPFKAKLPDLDAMEEAFL